MMTILAAIVVLVGVINIILLIACMILMRDSANTKLLMTQLHSAMSVLISKSNTHENALKQIMQSFTEFINTSSSMIDKLGFLNGSTKIFRSADGKYVGSSVHELLEKMREDGVEDKYFSKEDIENIRKLFEDASNDDDQDNSDDDTLPF